MDQEHRESAGKDGFLKGVLVGLLGSLLLITAVLGLVIFLGGSGRGNGTSAVGGSDPSRVDEKTVDKEIDRKIDEINNYINEFYIFDIDSQKLVDDSVAGYMEGLGDIYSVYYTEEEFAKQMEESDGSFVGIGVAVQQDPETKTITAMTVYKASPAETGGMEKGDIIVGVDGTEIQGLDLNDVVAMIRGEEGTQVVVRVYREGKYLDLTLTRAKVDKQTVDCRMLDDRIGYIALSEFDSVSVSQIKDAILDLQSQGMESLVLDLRDNPGGLLTSVTQIADFFLPETNIFYYEDKAGNRTDYNATSEQICTEPMVILVNGNSASASEVLSGSLKDHERATLIGEQTFGKGIVQSFFELQDGSAIKLTTAHYFTPNGTDIHGVGIEPNETVLDDPETAEVDEQLEAAIEELKK